MRAPLPDAEFQAIARETWLLDTARRASDVLAGAGVRSILLKGCALAGWLYPPGARPMTDCDLLVARHDRNRAARALEDAGFRRVPRPHSPTGMLWHPTLDFIAPSGVLVDLHVGIGAWPRFRIDEARLFAAAVPAIEVGGHALRPSVADLLWLHALDIAKDDGTIKATAVADLELLIAAAEVEDWRRAVACARETGCAATMWARLVSIGTLPPAAATAVAALTPSAPRRAAIRALGDGRRVGVAARLLSGWVHTDRSTRYAAALTFFAARTIVDQGVRAASR